MIFRRDNNIGTINTKTKKIHTLADRKGCLFSKVQVGIETFCSLCTVSHFITFLLNREYRKILRRHRVGLKDNHKSCSSLYNYNFLGKILIKRMSRGKAVLNERDYPVV